MNGKKEVLRIKIEPTAMGSSASDLELLEDLIVAAVKKPRAAKSGSAQAKAMEHPIVQRAQTLFNAEIRSVIDLREND
jgi:DNA polymerase-3 subunit gamma/tau